MPDHRVQNPPDVRIYVLGTSLALLDAKLTYGVQSSHEVGHIALEQTAICEAQANDVCVQGSGGSLRLLGGTFVSMRIAIFLLRRSSLLSFHFRMASG